MYAFDCQECKKSIFLIDKENEPMYFRLGLSEEFYCTKCADKIELEETDKVLREGKTFKTILRSDY